MIGGTMFVFVFMVVAMIVLMAMIMACHRQYLPGFITMAGTVTL